MSGYCPDCGNTMCLCKDIAIQEAKEAENIKLDHSCRQTCSGWQAGFDESRHQIDQLILNFQSIRKQLDHLHGIHSGDPDIVKEQIIVIQDIVDTVLLSQ